MKTMRWSEDRGRARMGWLDSKHTFSFGSYFDPKNMGFRGLRVINDDTVAPGHGFPTHRHEDMEIVTYPLEGALAHKDSTGTGSTIRGGDVQRMSAGSGVAHSETNPSKNERSHFLQIWILPEEEGIPPSYEEKHFDADTRRGKLRLIASRDAREGSLRIHADASIHAGLFAAGEKAELPLAPGRHAWVQVARGEVKLDGEQLREGDGVAISGESKLLLEGVSEGEVLVFDLA